MELAGKENKKEENLGLSKHERRRKEGESNGEPPGPARHPPASQIQRNWKSRTYRMKEK